MDNIPAAAILVSFQYKPKKGRLKDVNFHIWPMGKFWQWSAMGNNGEETTQNKAIEAAKNWIMFDKFN